MIVLQIICMVLVAIGALPVAVGLYQFLLIPIHAFRNHYPAARPHLPRVAVLLPAWNEGAVIGASIDRLIKLTYPKDRLRIYVVDDASTDSTPDVVLAKAAQYPGQVVHLRRDKGGEGKAHTLNHGIAILLADDWMQALLIMDADVIYREDSLRRMTAHLGDPSVGAVTAFIAEGSGDPNYLTRFIAYEYIAAQRASRRAQNVIGAMACLAGGAQLHSRENLEAIGGRIDTSSLAEDTFTTFLTQLGGRRVVFEPHAVVLAEEPGSIAALWKQRLRWARGNVQLTGRFRKVFFRPSKAHRLGSITFGLFWFTTFLLPVAMILSSIGLIGLYFLNSDLANVVFRATWFLSACTYVYLTLFALQLDGRAGWRNWREAILFPGVISLTVITMAFFPGLLDEWLPGLFGLSVSDTGGKIWTLFIYAWLSLCMVAAWGIKRIENNKIGRRLAPILVYFVGYGPLLCAITFDAYIKQFRGAAQVWDKTEKTGRVLA